MRLARPERAAHVQMAGMQRQPRQQAAGADLDVQRQPAPGGRQDRLQRLRVTGSSGAVVVVGCREREALAAPALQGRAHGVRMHRQSRAPGTLGASQPPASPAAASPSCPRCQAASPQTPRWAAPVICAPADSRNIRHKQIEMKQTPGWAAARRCPCRHQRPDPRTVPSDRGVRWVGSVERKGGAQGKRAHGRRGVTPDR